LPRHSTLAQLIRGPGSILALTLFSAFPLPTLADSDLRGMKTISYRGGVITFRIPANWKEEYDPEGGGTFYEDSPISGTLRLNVISAKSPPGKLPASGYDDLTSRPPAPGERIVRLKSGDGIKLSMKPSKEDGVPIEVYAWQVVHIVPPRKMYIAIFTWTILASHPDMHDYQNEIDSLTEEISKAVFSPELGGQ
jgi:hypothetical protein